MEQKIFYFSLIVSLLAHIGFFVQVSYSNIHHAFKPVKKVEVIYHQLKPQILTTNIMPLPEQTPEHKPVKQIKQLQKQETDTESLIKDLTKLADGFIKQQKRPSDVAKLSVKGKVSLPPTESENMDDPQYRIYYAGLREQVRQRIEDLVFANYDRFELGEVYLTFLVAADGTLQDLKLLESRTEASAYLKDISLKSVRQAAPFPQFPAELDYPELTFNIRIIFSEDTTY